MQLYKTTITPTSNFATPLKGDTLFGQICWGVYYSLGKKRLSKLLQEYKNRPFLVVSDAFAKGYLPKPKMPSYLLGEESDEKKKNRKKIWLRLNELKSGKYNQAKTNKELMTIEHTDDIVMHNSINYQGFHTKKGFDPYGEREFILEENDIYLLLDNKQLKLDELENAFDLVSQMGYGKDTTIGKGRFTYSRFKEVNNFFGDSKYYMSLSPISPQGLECKNIYYDPFTKFGKFGLNRAYKNSFKKPILLADTATVIEFQDKEYYQFLGQEVSGLSNIYKDTIHQGYSIVVPIEVKNGK
jgi:CRISPR-associated protein Csm4